MRQKQYGRRAFKASVAKLVRRTDIPLERLWEAFQALPERDRDTMPYVPRLLRLEA